ncbi:acyltransferase family protein [Cryobacterium sp. Y11]|uniref:acyltransferase family protein n=1 Tax=Cryobacterium sp. Y11 TaxID=2045016 RepID=UPI000CE3B5E1|nr:acyltransferase family protein [Cryobacterium sp. Y11]
MAERARVDWVDGAKGLAIVLVALAHAVQLTVISGLAPEFWNKINLVFIVFRMPLFFLASGLFARSIILRTWPALWRTRLSLLAWALLLWTLVQYGYFALLPSPAGLEKTDLINLLLSPVRPSNGLWFLYALALFFVAAKLMQNRIDWRVQVGGGAVLSVLFFARADTGNIAWNGMGRYFLFFLLGCYLREWILAFVNRPSRFGALGLGLGFGAAFLALAGIILTVDSRVPVITGALVLVSLLALGSGLLIARFLVGFRAMAWLNYVGRNTLPIYVMHVLFLSLITSLLLPWRGQAWLDRFGPALPLLVAGGGVAAALLFWRVVRDLPVLRYGFEVPLWFAGRPRIVQAVAGAAGEAAASASPNTVERMPPRNE